MKKILGLLLFMAVTISGTITVQAINFTLKEKALSTTHPEKTMYFVKIGNTISKLEDKGGYIIAAKRLGMESILIIPDGKVYRTVSIDLRKDDESLKDAIEVKLDEIIVAN
jgi:hypothetical protein